MQRILVLGGGVGGTLVANLISRKLKKAIDAGEASVTVVDETGTHVYQPGFMYIAMGGERAERLQRPERSLLDERVELVVGRIAAIDEAAHARAPRRTGGSWAGTSWCSRPARASCPRRSPTSREEAHHFYSAEAAAKLRTALDAFKGGKVVIGIAGHALQVPARRRWRSRS